MQVSDSLEVGIGLSFIFFLSSLVLASIHEMLEAFLKARSAFLFNGIKELLDDPKIDQSGQSAALQLYQHPQIRGLMRGNVADANFKKFLPSYIPTRNFALALMDQAAQGKLTPGGPAGSASATLAPLARLRLRAEGIENQQIRDALTQAIDNASGDINAAQVSIQHWFDSAMDRVSGWYKRRSQYIVFGLGLLMALALNVNTITIAQALSTSAELRQAVLSEAQKMESSQPGCAAGQPCDLTPTGAVAELDRTDIPIGWSAAAISALLAPTRSSVPPFVLLAWLEILSGYLLTAFAVTLGAPFWFDILNRLMVIRATVKPTEKSLDEASQDPQPSDNGPPVVSVALQSNPAPSPTGAARLPAIDADIYKRVFGSADRLFEADDGTAVPGITADAVPGS